jgi:prevent-host-death family protein
VRKASLADAKARLSALVDDAEHRGRRTLILRHGRPSAAIVPVDVAAPSRAAGRRARGNRLSPAQVRRLLSGLGKARPRHSAVADLLDGRR